MTLDQIDQMVRQANPVPDLTVLEPVDASVLVFDQQRRTDMQTHDRIEVDQGPKESGRGFLVGIAAAVVVVVGVLVLVRPMDGPVAASPIEVATAFVEAYGSFDADRAATYLADDADVSRLEAGVEGWQLGVRWMEAAGVELLLDSCEEEVGSAPGTVHCVFAFHAIRSDEIGLGPFGDSTFDFRILDGEIVSASMIWNIEKFGPQVWEPFAVWVAVAYPEDVTIMYTGSSQSMQRFTDEAIALWEQRSREYVEVARGGAEAENIATQFVEAYVAHDADKATSYLAADVDLSKFTRDLGLGPYVRMDVATGFKRLFDSCVATSAAPTGISVRCPYDFHGIRSEEIGLGPYSGSWWDIAIEDGQIVSVSDEIVFMENGFSDQMWEPFARWIGSTHPEDGAVMYVNWPSILSAQYTDESIALWEERSSEYVAVVNGG